ncbi:MAG: LL-diaminopimelate aminotransferase [Clostridium sp.]|nr:LL-diaminopimelate aminotransferase [Clostridium sp.]
MISINDNYLALTPSYLFSDIARRVERFSEKNPDARIIRMGIGDVTRPICQAAIEAMHRAVDDQASALTFHGYGPEQGYPFLRDKIAAIDFAARSIDISADEIFVGDGAKSDIGNILDILSPDIRVAVTDPVYPVYVDTNTMAGHRCIVHLPCTAENGFVPPFPEEPVDVVYLCLPNNPTGTVLTRSQLAAWVEYALEKDILILFDAAYEAFVSTPGIPRSIYEIEGARRCAIEFRSFSKTAGFTGLRCGYTVVPRELVGIDRRTGDRVALNRLWNRRQTTKFNGASYIIQRAAEALYTPAGIEQTAATIGYYRENAALIRRGFAAAGVEAYGGVDSPYIWVRTPGGMTSWEYFDYLLERHHIVGTPGSGFGACGEGYLRLTAFNSREATLEAVGRLLGGR